MPEAVCCFKNIIIIIANVAGSKGIVGDARAPSLIIIGTRNNQLDTKARITNNNLLPEAFVVVYKIKCCSIKVNGAWMPLLNCIYPKLSLLYIRVPSVIVIGSATLILTS